MSSVSELSETFSLTSGLPNLKFTEQATCHGHKPIHVRRCFVHLCISRNINVIVEIYSNYIHAFNEMKQKVLTAVSENFNLLCFSFWDFMVAFLVQLLC